MQHKTDKPKISKFEKTGASIWGYYQLVPAGAAAANTIAEVENVALHKPVLASSFVLPDEFAARAVDGVTGTQWRSAASSDEWIWVDLLGRHSLDHVQLLWGSQLPSSFILEISSNGVAWSAASAPQVASGSSQQVAMDGVVTQWLRVHCTGGCSLQELQVYGSPANDRLLHESVAPILL
eukprot:Skav203075  [mRNA]  locus=scaffold2182:15422:17403:+ [translate_table: standard]